MKEITKNKRTMANYTLLNSGKSHIIKTISSSLSITAAVTL